jgi:uncharacterized protein with NRDE domain
VCTLLFAWQVDPARPLVVAANRDEFYARPTAAAGFWADAPQLLAGRDLQAGGTWLGVTRDGRFAALTNVREPGVPTPPHAPSRGRLVADFLLARGAPEDYLAGLRPADHAGFNLVVGDGRSLWYLSNRAGPARALGPGVYGVSNAALDTPWPKVVRGRERLAALVAGGADTRALLDLLEDRAPAADAELPDTGVGLAMERLLSSLFIASPAYGTSSSTALVIHRDGALEFRERTQNPLAPAGAREVAYALAAPPVA